VYAAYDDLHSVEALSIIHKLLGDDPSKEEVMEIQHAIEKVTISIF